MFAWILIGLISGWLAGKILNGNGYGMLADIALGLVGGVIGGMIFAVLVNFFLFNAITGRR